MNKSVIEGLVTRNELAKKLGVTTDTLFNWAKNDYGPTPVRLGGRVRYRTGEVMEFLATLTGEPVG